MMDVCCIADDECTAPANLSPRVLVKTRCFACDQAVCKSCSKLVPYFNYGVRRICADCCDEFGLGALPAA